MYYNFYIKFTAKFLTCQVEKAKYPNASEPRKTHTLATPLLRNSPDYIVDMSESKMRINIESSIRAEHNKQSLCALCAIFFAAASSSSSNWRPAAKQ